MGVKYSRTFFRSPQLCEAHTQIRWAPFNAALFSKGISFPAPFFNIPNIRNINAEEHKKNTEGIEHKGYAVSGPCRGIGPEKLDSINRYKRFGDCSNLR